MKRKVQHLFSALVLAGFIFIAFASEDGKKAIRAMILQQL